MNLSSIIGSLRSAARKPVALVLYGFLAGSVFGLVILGWGVWPVEYVDAVPSVLQESYQIEYLRMAVDSYALTGDGATARTRYAQLGNIKAPILLQELKLDSRTDPARLAQFEALVAGLFPSAQPSSPANATPSFGAAPSSGVSLELIAVVAGFGIMIAAAIGAVLFVSRRRIASADAQEEPLSIEEEEEQSSRPTASRPRPSPDDQQPLERFVTTYVLGDDLYEDSFTINSAAGEFLGECGVGISEPIGVGDPKKITAFEVWLFDRKESRSSTSVLASQYAYQKPDLRASLAPRGNPVLVESGAEFWMETQTLQLRVQVREAQYGKEPLPEKSYFEKLILQLEIWVKN